MINLLIYCLFLLIWIVNPCCWDSALLLGIGPSEKSVFGPKVANGNLRSSCLGADKSEGCEENDGNNATINLWWGDVRLSWLRNYRKVQKLLSLIFKVIFNDVFGKCLGCWSKHQKLSNATSTWPVGHHHCQCLEPKKIIIVSVWRQQLYDWTGGLGTLTTLCYTFLFILTSPWKLQRGHKKWSLLVFWVPRQ